MTSLDPTRIGRRRLRRWWSRPNPQSRGEAGETSKEEGTKLAASRRLGWRLALLPILGLALLQLVVAFLEGDLSDAVADLGAFVGGVLNRYGAAASFGLLYMEESGVPIVIPGDVYVAYLGKLAAGSAPKLLASWLGIIAVVLAGSSNLYWASRRWGRRLLQHPRVSALLQLDPGRLAQAEAWLRRWGVLAIIFDRHIPGLRIPITVMAGYLEGPLPDVPRWPYRARSGQQWGSGWVPPSAAPSGTT